LGVEPIVVEKNVTSFDTDIHDAITMVNVGDEELKGKIIDCVQTGYKLNGKIIRHPKVVVGEFNT
jgi:molecular chaperone GrpE